MRRTDACWMMLEDRYSRSAMIEVMVEFYRMQRMCNVAVAGRRKVACLATHKTRRYDHQQWYGS